ncbi:putative xanthine dehydrogenase subunit A [Posidoniimonas corsicana]|uniref:Putative xanthine dehydrogenase subunit A n=1 Tax=Posidoniimonas corsicana TaxID=1938618 RepID=A0A5C5VBH4_9BACT|nr:xanthine dehydrogenase accessory protein XdhC [Posidoniimonas corsicana]TWT35898.1 putative xanthine dehydrogenase subunit A [Posidoniimonas corsicana]
MNEHALHQRCVELCAAADPFAIVTLVEAAGSTPSDAGAKMLVTPAGLDLGTVGGGRVEAKAIGVAQQMLAGGDRTLLVDWSLRTDVGMTCGGRVKLYFEVVNRSDWPVVIFGAGHVTQALASLLATLPCQVTCIDPRPEWLGRLPAGVRAIECAEPAERVTELAPNAFVLCMTRGHKSDLPVLRQIYQLPRSFPFVGVIGSRAKAKVLRSELVEGGCPTDRLDFYCPVGLPIGSNHPAEIAVSIAAQLLEARDRVNDQSASASAD